MAERLGKIRTVKGGVEGGLALDGSQQACNGVDVTQGEKSSACAEERA